MKSVLNTQVLDKARAAYAGLAIGDALGATVEFMMPREISSVHGVHKNITGGGWLKLKAGSVTDDTEMSLALGKSLVNHELLDVLSIAQAFSDWMRSKPVDIGNTVRRGILHFRTLGTTSVAKSDMNAGNGACMRTLPVALATFGATSQQVKDASRLQAHITHHSDLSDAGTEHVIQLLQYAIGGSDKSVLERCSEKFVSEFPLFRFDKREVANPGGYIVETLQAVLQSFYSTDNFESCLVDVVNRGGDADTTGAIAGMLAGAFYGYSSIPARWINKINQQVLHNCEQQAEALINIAPIGILNTVEMNSPDDDSAGRHESALHI